MFKYLIISALCLALTSCKGIPYPDDNFVEEGIERIIKDQTGVAVDFTGDSKES